MFFGLSGLPIDIQEKIIKNWLELKKENERKIKENEKSKKELALIELFKNDPTTSFKDMIVIGNLIAKHGINKKEVGINTEEIKTKNAGTNTEITQNEKEREEDNKSWFSW